MGGAAGLRALGRAVWVDGLGRAPFPVGTGGGEGSSSLSFVLGSCSSRLVDTHTYTHTHTHTHTKPDNITHSSISLITQTASPSDHVLGSSRMGRNLQQSRARIISGFRAHHIFLVVLPALRLLVPSPPYTVSPGNFCSNQLGHFGPQ